MQDRRSEGNMPRYLVERSITDGLHIPMDAIGAKTCAEVVATNLYYGVTWIHSYVTPDKTKTYCIYDAPQPRSRPPERHGEQAPGRPDHRGPCPGPLLLLLAPQERDLDDAGPRAARCGAVGRAAGNTPRAGAA